MLIMMSRTTSSADSIGTQVSGVLSEAQFKAAELLDEADSRAYRAGRDELANLRGSLQERIEALRAARARLKKLGAETVPRVREAAAQLSAMPASLAESTRDPAENAALGFDADEEAPGGPSSHLVAMVKAAEMIADDLAEEARRKAQQVEEAARREADRIASQEPQRLTEAYDPAARRAEALRREVEALNQELGVNEDVAETAGVNERTGRWNRAR